MFDANKDFGYEWFKTQYNRYKEFSGLKHKPTCATILQRSTPTHYVEVSVNYAY